MKIKLLLLLIGSIVTISVSAQQKTITEDFGNISEIKLSGKLNVTYIPSDKNSVKVDLYNCEISRFGCGVEEGELNITLKQSGKKDGYADVTIWCKSTILKLDISEASFISENVIISEMIELDVSSSAKVTAEFQAIDMEIKVASNAIMSISGESKYLDIHAAENSRIDTRKMDVVSGVAESGSKAEIYINVEERLVATAKTGSTIFYSGDPVILKLTTPKMSGLGAGIHKLK